MHPYYYDVTSLRRGGLEFKKVSPMSVTSLQQLHGSMIEVVLEVGGALRSVRGEGKFERGDPDLGRVLRVLVADQAGDFELLIPESSWEGNCDSSSLPGCKFKISLSPSPSCH